MRWSTEKDIRRVDGQSLYEPFKSPRRLPETFARISDPDGGKPYRIVQIFHEHPCILYPPGKVHLFERGTGIGNEEDAFPQARPLPRQ